MHVQTLSTRNIHIWEAEICLSEISGIATYLDDEEAGRRVKNMVSFIP
jgi:hypothetical protein